MQMSGSVMVCYGFVSMPSFDHSTLKFCSTYAAFKVTSFLGMALHFSTGQYKITCCTLYKGMAVDEEGKGPAGSVVMSQGEKRNRILD